MDLLREGGIEAVNVKTLAKKLNCSTQPIYLSFPGMDELRVELMTQAVRLFADELQKQNTEKGDLFGMAYIRFAMEENDLENIASGGILLSDR